MKNRNTIFRATLLVIVCLALLPGAQAVSPPPDGGYPGGNTAEGQSALLSLTSGAYNTAVGFLSLASDTTNNFNTAIGAGALFVNTADQNTAIGTGALLSNTIGAFNTADGAFALFSNTTGGRNTASGVSALFSNTTGSGNTAIGIGALVENTSGGSNIALGDSAGIGVSTADNVICIGAGVKGANVSNTCFISNIYGVTTLLNDAVPVQIDSTGNLGTASSSRQYKSDIKPIEKASESILALKPVSFRYKVHKDNTPQFGLIAEEVAEVNPDLVVRDHNGQIYSVRYDAVNAMLLNEFLKEHKIVERQQVTIAELRSTVAQQRKDFEAIAAKQQGQIQALTVNLEKVTARVAAVNPSHRTADGATVSKSLQQRIQHSRPTRIVLNNP